MLNVKGKPMSCLLTLEVCGRILLVKIQMILRSLTITLEKRDVLFVN